MFLISLLHLPFFSIYQTTYFYSFSHTSAAFILHSFSHSFFSVPALRIQRLLFQIFAFPMTLRLAFSNLCFVFFFFSNYRAFFFKSTISFFSRIFFFMFNFGFVFFSLFFLYYILFLLFLNISLSLFLLSKSFHLRFSSSHQASYLTPFLISVSRI